VGFGHYNDKKDIPNSLDFTAEENVEKDKFEKNVIYSAIFEQEKNEV